jgi:hypothetical protein
MFTDNKTEVIIVVPGRACLLAQTPAELAGSLPSGSIDGKVFFCQANDEIV